MDNLFKVRALTQAVNDIVPPPMKAYLRLFAKKASGQVTDRLAYDVISGSDKVLNVISVVAAAQVTDQDQPENHHHDRPPGWPTSDIFRPPMKTPSA